MATVAEIHESPPSPNRLAGFPRTRDAGHQLCSLVRPWLRTETRFLTPHQMLASDAGAGRAHSSEACHSAGTNMPQEEMLALTHPFYPTEPPLPRDLATT